MADTLTIAVSPETAARLRHSAEQTGETPETLASRLVEEAVADLSGASTQSVLTDDQLADLRERLKRPRQFVSDVEVQAYFARHLPREK